MFRKLILLLTAAGLAIGAAGCNTVRGAGDDLQSAANEVDKEI